MSTLLMTLGIFFSQPGSCDNGRCTPVRTVSSKVVEVAQSRPVARTVRRVQARRFRIFRGRCCK